MYPPLGWRWDLVSIGIDTNEGAGDRVPVSLFPEQSDSTSAMLTHVGKWLQRLELVLALVETALLPEAVFMTPHLPEPTRAISLETILFYKCFYLFSSECVPNVLVPFTAAKKSCFYHPFVAGEGPILPNVIIWEVEWFESQPSPREQIVSSPDLASIFIAWTPRTNLYRSCLILVTTPEIKMLAGITQDRLRLTCGVLY